MGYDAEIRICTKVDTGKMRKLQAEIDKSTYKVDALSKRYKELKNQKVPTEEYKRLQKELSEATREMENMLSKDSKFSDLENEIKKLTKSSADYAAKMQEIAGSKVPTQGYANVQNQIDSCDRKLGTLTDRQERFLATGGKENSGAYKKMAYDAEKLKERIIDLEKHAQRMRESGKAFTSGIDTEKYKNLAAQYEETNKKLNKSKALHEEIARKQAEAVQKTLDLKNQISQLVETGKAFTLGKDTDEFKKTRLGLESEKAHLTQLINKQKELGHKQVKVSDGLKRIGSTGKKAFRGINIGAKKTGGLLNTLKSRMKGLLLKLLIFNWISRGFYRMISSIKEGFKNLAQYSDEYNRSMSNLMNSSNQLKNNLAAAFEPIATRILQHLTKFIDYLNSAAEAFSRFMAVLSGKSTYTRAVRKNDDYAKSLKETTDSAKEAAGAVKDTAEEVEKLAAFDNIDVLEKQTNTQSNHTANNSGSNEIGNPGGSQTYFEEAEVGQVSGWLASLKDAIKNGDWYAVGALFAEKINETLSGLNWPAIQEKAKAIAMNIINLLNGHIDHTDWGLIGSTIANGLMIAFMVAYLFFTKTHWEELGVGIAKLIMDFFTTMKWQLVGDTMAEGILAAFKFLYNVITHTDFGYIADCMIDMIKGFVGNPARWRIVGKTLGAGLQGAIDFLKRLVGEMPWKDIVDACGEILGGLFEEIDLGDVAVILAVILGAKIGKGIAGIGISAIKKKFGAWVTSKFVPGIIKMIEGGFTSSTFAATGATIIQFLIGAVIAAIGGWNLGQLLYEVITGEKIDMTWTEQFETIFDSLKDGSWKEACKLWGKDIAGGLKEGWESECKFFKKSMETLKTTNIKILSFIGKSWMEGVTNIDSLLGKFSASTKKTWEGIFKMVGNTELGKAIKKPVNIVIYGMEKMINSVISGLNAMVDALNNLKIDIPEWIPSIGGKSFGLNLAKVEPVELPKLATGAVFRGGDPYAAIVNDQPRGQTNVETPLATMVQAFNQALDSRGGAGPVEVVLQFTGDNAQLARHLNPILAEESARRGVSLVIKGV